MNIPTSMATAQGSDFDMTTLIAHVRAAAFDSDRPGVLIPKSRCAFNSQQNAAPLATSCSRRRKARVWVQYGRNKLVLDKARVSKVKIAKTQKKPRQAGASVIIPPKISPTHPRHRTSMNN